MEVVITSAGLRADSEALLSSAAKQT